MLLPLATCYKSTFAMGPPVLTVSYPQLTPGEFFEVPDTFNQTVLEDVTSTFSYVNVTLYYFATNDSSLLERPPANVSAYSQHEQMSLIFSNKTTDQLYHLIYLSEIPRQLNNTSVLTIVKAAGPNDTTALSIPEVLFQVFAPHKQIILSIELNLLDIGPQSLGMNLSVTGYFDNTKGYNVTSWFGSTSKGFWPQFYTRLNASEWQANKTYVTQIPNLGHPKLFPFDSYDYEIYITLQKGINYTSVNLNQVNIPAGTEYFTFPARSTTFKEITDISEWNYTAQISYIPLDAPNGTSSVVIFFHLLHRSPDTTNILVLPVMAMYALLGGSIILQRKKDLGNRLAIYLTVVVFSFGFFTGIRTLETVPTIIGLTMIERLTLALVPSTASVAIFSMVGIWSNRLRPVLDFVGLSVALYATYEISSFTDVISYNPLQTFTFSIFSLGNWSWYFVGFLFLGMILSIPLIVWRWNKKRIRC